MSRNLVTYDDLESKYPIAWSPAEIPTVAWYDATDPTTLWEDTIGTIPATTVVGQWADKSGRNQHLTMGIAGRQPITNSRQLNGLNVLDFTPLQSMSRSGFITRADGLAGVYYNIPIDLAMFGVHVVDPPTGSSFKALWSMNAGSDQGDMSSGNATNFNGLFEGGPLLGANITFSDPPHNGPSVYNATYNSSMGVKSVSVDGTVRGINAMNNFASGYSFRMMVSTSGTASNTEINGACGEWLAVSDVTLEMTQKIEGYLAHKWGIASKLPTNHPYKFYPPKRGT